MGFWEWLSGRNSLYKNDAAINNLYDELNSIKTGPIETARQDCRDAIKRLNSVKGMEYVGTIGEESFDSIYDEICSAVDIIKQQVEGKVADMDAYSNAKWYEKVGSTATMTLFKAGEGFLSVFESIGDGLVSVAGFVGGGLGAKGFQEGCAKIIQKSLSHDLFNFYYNSDFAKASAYTEDSGAASIVKIAGQTGAYLLLGGFASGAAGKLASSGSKLVQGAGKFLASTTRTNTSIAAVGGLGQGTETGLNAGLDYNTAFGKGAKQALVQGGTAYIFGRLGEKAQKSAATKSAQNDLAAAQKEASSAEAAVSKAKQGVTEAETALGKAEKGVADAQKTLEGATKARPGIETKLTKAQTRLGNLETAAKNNPRKFRTPGKQKQIADARNQVTSLQRDLNGIDTRIGEASKNLTAAQEGRTAAQKAVSVAKDGVYDARATLAEAKIDVTDANEAVKLAQNSKYQGYTDSLTKTGQKAGASVGAKGVKATIKDAAGSVKDGVKNLGQPLERNPLVQNQGTLAKVKDAGVAIYNNTGTVGRTAISGVGKVVSAPVQVTKEVVKGMAGAVAQQPNVAGKAAVVAVEAAGVATGTGFNYANAQARTAANNLNAVKPAIQSIGGTPTTVDITPSAKNTGNITGQSGNSGNTGNTGNTGNNGNTGGPGNNGNNYNNWNTTPPAQNPTPPTTTPTQPTNPVTPATPTTPIDPVIPTPPTDPTPPTTPTEPTTPENPGTTITNPDPTPTPPVRSDNGGSNSGVDHGGNYDNGTGNIWSGTTDNGEVTEPELPDGELPIEEPTDTELPGTEESVYTIPTDLSGVTTKKKSSSGSSVIPILGGLGAAAAVGVGAKIYMDNKKNNDNGEDDDYTDDFEFKDENNDNGDDLLADEWKEDDNDDTSLNFNDIVNDASEDNNDLGEI